MRDYSLAHFFCSFLCLCFSLYCLYFLFPGVSLQSTHQSHIRMQNKKTKTNTHNTTTTKHTTHEEKILTRRWSGGGELEAFCCIGSLCKRVHVMVADLVRSCNVVPPLIKQKERSAVLVGAPATRSSTIFATRLQNH